MELSKVMLNSARLRIMQYICVHGRVNTAAIVDALSDIPRATIYHHIKILEESKLIEVVEEKRVRNTTEKIYAARITDVTAIGDNPIQLSAAFHTELMQEFSRYFSSQDVDIKRDQVFFSSACLSVTDEEYMQLLGELKDLIVRYSDFSKTPERRLRKLSLISSPPQKEGACGRDGVIP